MTQSIEIYQSDDGQIQLEVSLNQETVWLSQAQMAALFGTKRPAITKHLSTIFKSGELDENTTCSILEHMAEHGQTYKTKHDNLDAIISIGYRVDSSQATQFRIWATRLIKEYIIKGFAMDDERLKNGRFFGKDYFKKLLERVRSIRAGERRIYQQITAIFAEYEKFNKQQKIESDFEREVKNCCKKGR